MSPGRADLLQRIEKAIPEYLLPLEEGGLTQTEICEKYGIGKATLRRHLKRRGLSLSPLEQAKRRARGGEIKNVTERSKCVPGCTCPKHNNRPIMGRRLCTYKDHVGPRWLPISYFHARERLEDGTPVVWQTWCTTCARIDQRVRMGIARRGRPYKAGDPARPRQTHDERLAKRREQYRRRMLDPEWAERRREYERAWHEAQRRAMGVEPRVDLTGMTREERLAYDREYRRRLMQDPVRRELKREYARIWHEAQRRRRGARQNSGMIERRSAGAPKSDPVFPLGPFQDWIRERAAFYASDLDLIVAEGEVAGLGHLARVCDINPRSLRRYLDGGEISAKTGQWRPITTVTLGTVDKCLTNEGTTFLWELYDEAEGELEMVA
jgi:hypothetical protein